MNTTVNNVSITGFCLAGEKSETLNEKQVQTIAEALKRSKLNVFGSIGGRMDDQSCGVADAFLTSNGNLVSTIEFFEINPRAAGFISLGSAVANEFEGVVVLAGPGPKASLAAGRLHSTEIRGIWLVKKDGSSVEMAESMVSHLNASGRAGSRFAALVEKHIKLGARHPFVAALRESPADYNEYRKEHGTVKNAPSRKLEDETATTHQLSVMHGELRRIDRLSSVERPAAIIKFARQNPKAYNLARSKNLI